MTQAQINAKFLNFYNTLAGYGSTGQGWPLEVYWYQPADVLTSTFNRNAPHTFHIGANGNAKVVTQYGALTEDGNDNAGSIIIAPFSISNTKVNGVDKDHLYLRRNLAVPMQMQEIYPGTPVFCWRFTDSDRPEWYVIEDNRKEAFMRNNGFGRIPFDGSPVYVEVGRDPQDTTPTPEPLENRSKSNNVILFIGAAIVGLFVAGALIFMKK